MTSRPRLTALLASLVLAATPAAAFGQNAGDDQYEDPFGDESPSSTTEDAPPIQDSAPGLGSQAEPEPTPAPQAEPVPEPGPATESGPAAASGTELPRTGAEPLALALLGTGLILGGTGLRLRLRPAPGDRRA